MHVDTSKSAADLVASGINKYNKVSTIASKLRTKIKTARLWWRCGTSLFVVGKAVDWDLLILQEA